ncbi:MAG: alpha-L-fucosidase [Planctomycetes bacterium]|nr:alpha-L-fucosidase [Planctomycetota bacterium]
MSDVHDAATQHAIIGNADPAAGAKTHTRHPEAQWFAQAGLGLFIHFGISSVRGDGDLSWSMMYRPPGSRGETVKRYGHPAVQAVIPPEDYWKQAEGFAPASWDPQAMLAAAKRAGMTYAVLTSKHHDGYTLWPSRFSDLGTHTHLGGRDLVRPYVEACRRLGLKVGLYYSPPDWRINRHHMSYGKDAAGRPLGQRHEPLAAEPVADGPALAAYHAQVRGQLEELLTGYGRIDLLWLDGSAPGAFTNAWLRTFQPHLVVNRRQAPDGDYDTPECRFPEQRPQGWWEYCHIWNDGAWGYLRHEIYKPAGWMLGELAKARAWGGNFLVNVGPGPTGALPAAGFARLAEVEAWMAHSAEAVSGTAPGPWPEQSSVPVTVRGSTWYLHLLWDHDGEVALSGVADPAQVRLLRDGTVLAWRREGDRVVIDCPLRLRSVLTDVVAVTFTG